MKTFVKLLMCVACMALLSSCEKDDDFKAPSNRQVLRDFDASFVVRDLTQGRSIPTKNGCLKTWKGDGNSLLFGEFNAHITLFCDMNNLTFFELQGTLTFKDGSEIYFSIGEGKIVCNGRGSTCQSFHFKFSENATIEGGTQRFQGAKGSFKTDVMIHNAKNPDWFAQFACDGKIVFRIIVE